MTTHEKIRRSTKLNNNNRNERTLLGDDRDMWLTRITSMISEDTNEFAQFR